MKTTFEEIKKYDPCIKGWKKLITYYKPECLSEEVTIKEIIKSNGIKDAIWALRAVDDNKSILLISADIAEMVLPNFQKEFPNDYRVELCIKAVRDFANDLISLKDLKKARLAAESAESAAKSASWSAWSVRSAESAWSAARSASWSAWSVRSAAAESAWSAARSAAWSVESAAKSAESDAWNNIEQILMKYL